MRMMMESAAEDVMSDAQPVTARPLERAVASLPRSSTTTSPLRAESTRTRRRIRRARRLVGLTLGLTHGFKTILMPLRHRKIHLLSTTRLRRIERGAAEENRVDTRNMTM
jgi:hypothetical protein